MGVGAGRRSGQSCVFVRRCCHSCKPRWEAFVQLEVPNRTHAMMAIFTRLAKVSLLTSHPLLKVTTRDRSCMGDLVLYIVCPRRGSTELNGSGNFSARFRRGRAFGGGLASHQSSHVLKDQETRIQQVGWEEQILWTTKAHCIAYASASYSSTTQRTRSSGSAPR